MQGSISFNFPGLEGSGFSQATYRWPDSHTGWIVSSRNGGTKLIALCEASDDGWCSASAEMTERLCKRISDLFKHADDSAIKEPAQFIEQATGWLRTEVWKTCPPDELDYTPWAHFLLITISSRELNAAWSGASCFSLYDATGKQIFRSTPMLWVLANNLSESEAQEHAFRRVCYGGMGLRDSEAKGAIATVRISLEVGAHRLILANDFWLPVFRESSQMTEDPVEILRQIEGLPMAKGCRVAVAATVEERIDTTSSSARQSTNSMMK